MVGVGERVIAAGPGANGLKDGALALPIQKVAGGDAVAVAIDFGPDHDELVRIGVGHGRKKSGVNDAENGGVGPDSENEGEEGDRGKPKVFEEQPEAKANVARKICHMVSPQSAR